MAFTAAIDGTRLYYQLEGPADGPALVLSNSLGSTLELWDRLVPSLGRFRLLRYDTRGHGRSGAPEGDYAFEQLGGDVLAILDHAGIAKASFCGISMGGGIGQWLALNAPERIDRLVLANSAAVFGSPDVWAQRIETVRTQGLAALAPGVIERWFTPEFREREPREVQRIAAVLLATPPQGYAGCCAALRDADFRPSLARISTPTLVIGGARDPSTPLPLAEELAAGIPGARLAVIDAAHLTCDEQPAAFAAALEGFL